MMKYIYFTLIFSILSVTNLFAELTVPNFFSDHMVLQRDVTATIWGASQS